MKYHSALRVNACLLAMLVISGSVSAATQINALFMTQAAYSENDIRAMTSDFEKQHPDVKVNLEFVPYEALHDKIVAARGAGGNGYDVVLFDAIWPAEFSRFDLLQDVSSRIAPDEREKIFPGAMNTVVYQRQNPRHAVDPRHQISVLQQSHAGQSRDQNAASQLAAGDGRR